MGLSVLAFLFRFSLSSSFFFIVYTRLLRDLLELFHCANRLFTLLLFFFFSYRSSWIMLSFWHSSRTVVERIKIHFIASLKLTLPI